MPWFLVGISFSDWKWKVVHCVLRFYHLFRKKGTTVYKEWRRQELSMSLAMCKHTGSFHEFFYQLPDSYKNRQKCKKKKNPDFVFHSDLTKLFVKSHNYLKWLGISWKLPLCVTVINASGCGLFM